LLDDTDPSIRLRASLGLIEVLGKLRDRVEFARRLEALEQARESSDLAIEATLVQARDDAWVPDNAYERPYASDIRENDDEKVA
jgi:hypothetical protein